jgi:hypothetical protein
MGAHGEACSLPLHPTPLTRPDLAGSLIMLSAGVAQIHYTGHPESQHSWSNGLPMHSLFFHSLKVRSRADNRRFARD